MIASILKGWGKEDETCFDVCRLDNHGKSKKHKEKVALLKQLMKEEEEEVEGAKSEGVPSKDGGGCGDDIRERTKASCKDYDSSDARIETDSSSSDATGSEGIDGLDAAPDPVASSLGELGSKEIHGVDLSEIREDPLCGKASCNSHADTQPEESANSSLSESEANFSLWNT